LKSTAAGIAAIMLAVLLGLTVLSSVFAQHEPEDGLEAEIAAGPPLPYGYRTFSEIQDIMYATESSFPDIVKVYDIGDSWETTEGLADRDILAVKISDNVEVEEDEPEILVMALHHAREWPTSEIAVQLIENLTANYGEDSRVSWLVDNRQIWIVPVVNPDGLEYAMTYDDMWRKNRRDNGDGTFGVDLNRNYNGSENDDPLGEWGGAGTSFDTSDATYCGAGPFSEPETQAIRDLARAHDFAIAVDLHTYSDLVMWPWGYTTNLTDDDEDLSRIGAELAAINGYTADQSVGLYPTTGDTLDWLYGSLNVYSFLFEIGGNLDGFNPDDEAAVLELIAENVPAIMLAIEISGDREEKAFDIAHDALPDSTFSSAGFNVEADVVAERGVDESSTAVVYRVDGGEWSTVSMDRVGETDAFVATIPSAPAGSGVEYYVSAEDTSGVLATSPGYAPYEVHSFEVLPDTVAPVPDAGDDATVDAGELVVFDGSGSSDDDAIANYTWTFVYDGVERELYGVSPHFTFLIPGVYSVTLTVTDESGNHAASTMTVTVLDEAIPEFGSLVVPVVAVLLVFVFVRRQAARKD
jgi:hypothetical protein